LKEEALDHNR